MYICPYKRQISVIRLIALRGERGTFTTQLKRYIHVYKDQSRVVEILLQLENKQQSMQNNVETQHKQMHSLYIGSLCNIAFPMARFVCIVTSQIRM